MKVSYESPAFSKGVDAPFCPVPFLKKEEIRGMLPSICVSIALFMVTLLQNFSSRFLFVVFVWFLVFLACRRLLQSGDFREQWQSSGRMTQQGAVLQGYNNELVKCIEDLCMQKEELNKQIQQAEEEKNKLQHEIQILSEQLECVCENLAQKVASRNELDKILAETEAAYMKILDSSRTLLNVLKKEVGSLKHTPELKTNVT